MTLLASHYPLSDQTTATRAAEVGELDQRTISGEPASLVQRSVRLPRHLYADHSEYFTSLSPASVASMELALDDIRLFRSNLLLLSHSETLRVITGIQDVCHDLCRDMSFTLKLLTSCLFVQCLDNCPADRQVWSEKLKLLQDIYPLSRQFPETYWLTDIAKGSLISRGGEATVYKGVQGNRLVVVRQLHTALLGGEEDPENQTLMKVSKNDSLIPLWIINHFEDFYARSYCSLAIAAQKHCSFDRSSEI